MRAEHGDCSGEDLVMHSAVAMNDGFPYHEIRHIVRIVTGEQQRLVEAWNEYFSD